MRTVSIIFLAGFLLFSCTPEPKPIVYGSDMCEYCKMTIVDQQHGCELVSSKGKVFKFDAIECLIPFIGQNTETQFVYKLVNDYENPGELIDANKSHYLVSKNVPSPMGANLSAFSSRQAAESALAKKGGSLYDWESIKKLMGERTAKY